jgi:hypothetical protein
VGITRLPALALVAEPASVVSVEHPKGTLLVLVHELGYFKAELLVAQGIALVQALQLLETAFSFLIVHQLVLNGQPTAGPAKAPRGMVY